MNNSKTWQGKVNVNVPPIQLQELKQYLPDSLQVEQGHFALNLDLELDQKGIASSRSELDLQVILLEVILYIGRVQFMLIVKRVS